MILTSGKNSFSVSPIEFRNVSLRFGEKTVLANVSFKLEEGQMIVLTGASSSGKSVLLHLAIGLLQPTEGEILIRGRSLQSLNEQEILQLRSATMGMVFQSDTLFSGLTIYENAAYRLTEHGWAENDIEVAVTEILRFVGLETDLEKYPEELSVGMRRRLEMARALVGWPSIMLFDEPTSGLDPINARKVLDLIIRARDTYKISSICATKEMSDISYLANHHAVQDKTGISIVKGYAPPAGRLAVMVLDEGMLSFVGTESEFQGSQNPSVATLTGLQINPAPASDSYKHLSS